MLQKIRITKNALIKENEKCGNTKFVSHQISLHQGNVFIFTALNLLL